MKKTLITLFMMFFLFAFAHAQWSEEMDVNTLCTTNEALDVKAVGTDSGGTYIVFWRNQPAPVNIDLRVQYLDADGFAQFGDDGMLISDQISMGSYTVLWSVVTDDEDNLYVGVTGTGGGDPAYVFKIDTEGNLLYGENGINVGSGNDMKLLPIRDGELLVSWLSSSNGKANVQRYNAEGEAAWEEPLQVLMGNGSTSAEAMFEMSDGDFIIVFHEHMGFGINSELRAQRYGLDKTPRWSAPTSLSNLGTVWNRTYSSLQIDDVVYIGYHASSGTRFDSYIQRLNSDGSLPWGINGMDFNSNQTDYEMTTHIAHLEGSPYIWAVCSYTDTGQGLGGDYIQKMDKDTGERLMTNHGKEVFPIGSGKIHMGDLQVTPDDNPIFIYSSNVSVGGFIMELSAVQLDSDGDILGEPTPVATYYADKGRISFTKMVNGQSVAVFLEDKGDGDQIYAQNVIAEADEEVEECPTPTDLSVEPNPEDTESSVIVTWIAGGDETMWAVVYGEEGFTEDDDFNTELVFDTTLTISDLDYETVYDIYVVAVCDAATMNVSEQSGPLSFSMAQLSVSDISYSDFTYYPNPVNNQLTLKASTSIENIKIYNLSGQIITSLEPGSVQANVESENWSAGIYIMKVTINGVTRSFKIIKK